MRTVEIGSDQGELRLDRFLRKRFRDAPLSLIYKVIRQGRVRVNGRRAAPDERLKPGDTVTFDDWMQDFDRFIRDEAV